MQMDQGPGDIMQLTIKVFPFYSFTNRESARLKEEWSMLNLSEIFTSMFAPQQVSVHCRGTRLT